MLTDISRSPVSLEHKEALEHWNKLILAVLSHGKAAPTHLNALMELEPNFAMGHATRGLFCLMLAKSELISVASQAYKTAKEMQSKVSVSQREAAWIDALGLWLSGQPKQAIQTIEQILMLNPEDTFSLKLSHGIRFMIGDNHGMRRSVERVIAAHGHDHPLRGYALGCLAFSQEETGSYKEAEQNGLEGLTLTGDDAWGMHAVAHVYDMTNAPDKGLALIEGHMGAWNHCNNFRYHVWWHKALLHLDMGDFETALSLYDQKIRFEKTDDYRDFSNASSLLVRLQLEGQNVGNRWEELADLAEKRSEDGCLTFADLHYMLALSADQRKDAKARLIARVSQSASQVGDMAKIMEHPGVNAAKGLSAFGEGRYETAYAHLSKAQPALQDIGGSHAQRDVFERITIDAALRAGQINDAQQLLKQRSDIRCGAQDSFTLARLDLISDLDVISAKIPAF